MERRAHDVNHVEVIFSPTQPVPYVHGYPYYPVFPLPHHVPRYPYSHTIEQQAVYFQLPFYQYPVTREQLDQLRRQVEFYFSFENLVRDEYLLKQLEIYKGLVPCQVVANFNRVVRIMGGVPASNYCLTLALLHSNVVRVLFGNYLVPFTDVYRKILELRSQRTPHAHAENCDVTTESTSPCSKSTGPEDKTCNELERPNLTLKEKRKPKDADDKEFVCSLSPPPSSEQVEIFGIEKDGEGPKKEQEPTSSVSSRKKNDLDEVRFEASSTHPGHCKSTWEDESSRLLKGMLGLDINK